MATDWKELEEAEDRAYLMADIARMAPATFTVEQQGEILKDMVSASFAIEDALREDFAALDKQMQTKLLDSLGASGAHDRAWWQRLLMDGPRRRDRITV